MPCWATHADSRRAMRWSLSNKEQTALLSAHTRHRNTPPTPDCHSQELSDAEVIFQVTSDMLRPQFLPGCPPRWVGF